MVPTIRTRLPAALRRRLAILPTFLLIVSTAVVTQPIGSGALAHFVTSLPEMDTVTRAVCLRCFRRKLSAAASWVLFG